MLNRNSHPSRSPHWLLWVTHWLFFHRNNFFRIFLFHSINKVCKVTQILFVNLLSSHDIDATTFSHQTFIQTVLGKYDEYKNEFERNAMDKPVPFIRLSGEGDVTSVSYGGQPRIVSNCRRLQEAGYSSRPFVVRWSHDHGFAQATLSAKVIRIRCRFRTQRYIGKHRATLMNPVVVHFVRN